MNKKFLLFIIVAIAAVTFTQCDATKKSTSGNSKTKSDVVTLTTILDDKKNLDSLGIYQFDGIDFKKIKMVGSTGTTGKDTFNFDMKKSVETFYYVGVGNKPKKPVLVKDEANPVIRGSVNNMYNGKVSNSKLNDDYNEMMNSIRGMQKEMNNLFGEYAKAAKDPKKVEAVTDKMKVVDDKKEALLNSLKKKNPFLSKVAALFSFQTFQNYPLEHTNEVEHFAKAYFNKVDFADTDYNRIPAIFEGFKTYAMTLARIGLKDKQVISYTEDLLNKWTPKSNAHKYALGGVVLGMQSMKHKSFSYFGKKYLEQFDDGAPYLANLRKEIARSQKVEVGADAPDFVMNNEDGKPVKLSDFKGKVLLVDFWASWCGPCRRENPHVVKIYEKYKDMGFEVLGVSLDKKKDPWLKAIAKDKLTWAHVSDLKGWKNEAAAMYGVRSIPHTVLLDKDGKIIAQKLRSGALERELKKIFGK